MAEYLIQGESLTAIADAIRSQTGETSNLSLDAMAESIGNISGTNFSIVGGTKMPNNPDTLYWDGNTEELEHVEFWYKVSDIAPSLIDLSNGYILISRDGVINTDANVPVFEYDFGLISVCEDLCFIAPYDNLETPAGIFSKGVYFANTQASLKINNYTGFSDNPLKENTIWVNTDEEITSWIFSATQPETAEEGMVWISTGTSSTAEFNALKNNGVMVYPISAKQYINGAWVAKATKVYQGGKWVDFWNGTLYSYGVFEEILTGGCTAIHGNTVDNKLTEESTGLKLYLDTYSGSHIVFNNKINLRNVSKLQLTYEVTRVVYNGPTVKLLVADNKVNSYSGAITTLASAQTYGDACKIYTIELNVAEIDEGYIYMSASVSGNYSTCDLYIREVKAVLI